MSSLSVIIPTNGKRSLYRTLKSIEEQHLSPRDEVWVLGDGPQPVAEEICARFPFVTYRETSHAGRHGHPQRNFAMSVLAGAEWLVWMDDDDIFTGRAFDAIRAVVSGGPQIPHLFRFRTIHGSFLWQTREIQLGTVGGHMFVTPRNPERLGEWLEDKYEGDYYFIFSTIQKYNQVEWNRNIIAISRPESDLVAELVRTDEQLEQLREIRNSCREYMTRHTAEISVEGQRSWWRDLDPSTHWAYLYRFGATPECESPVVGYGLIRRLGEKMWVSGGLLPEWRGKRLGRELFEHLTYACQEDSWLEVREDNFPARSTYDKLGYKELPPKDGMVRMVWGLP